MKSACGVSRGVTGTRSTRRVPAGRRSVCSRSTRGLDRCTLGRTPAGQVAYAAASAWAGGTCTDSGDVRW